jgi:glycosyltransferase involved in cell wall biosynthesis
MKILMIHHSEVLGGGTLSCFDIISALKKDKYNLLLSLPSGKNAAREKAHELDLNILDDDIKPLIFGYYNGGSNLFKVIIKSLMRLGNLGEWKKLIIREKPDIVLLNSMILWPMIPLLSRFNIKSIVFVRETMKGNSKRLINRLVYANLQKATGVAFLSQFDQKQWNLSDKVIQSIIPDVVDVDEFSQGIDKESSRKQLNLKNNVFYILYVGGMNELKGVRTIIHAMNHCKSLNIELLFLGELGEELLKSKGISSVKNKKRIALINEINRYVHENKLEKCIRFVGMQKEMNIWYSACDVVVFPAKEAHQARPIYEAGVFKKPIIASNFQNYMEYLKPGISGLVFEPENHKDLAQEIEKLYKDPISCDKLGKGNFDLMNRFHNSKEVNNRIRNFIQDVALY